MPNGAFPPNKSAGLSARSCVTSQVHEAILWAIFAPAGHKGSKFQGSLGLAVEKNMLYTDILYTSGDEVEAASRRAGVRYSDAP